MFAQISAFFAGLVTLASTVKSIIQIAVMLFNYVRVEYEKHQRALVAKEIKDAVKEQVETLDNTRLNNVFSPHSEPFPIKTEPKT